MIGNYTATRPRGFAAYNPQKKARALIASVGAVLETYAEHLPLTLRQAFYALVGRDRLDKTEAAYERLCEVVNRARRGGLLEWDAFRDDGTITTARSTHTGPAGFAEAMRYHVQHFYRRDRLNGQPAVLEVWCEAGGMVPQLDKVCEPYGVAVYSGGGFDSTTLKHEAGERLAKRSRPTVIFHVGDLDPSGISLFDAVAADVAAFVKDLGGPPPEFVRLAVTPEQVRDLGLATAPPKATDRRGGFTGQTTQAEAIPPDKLAEIVRLAVTSRLDLDRLAQETAQEEADRAVLLRALDPLSPFGRYSQGPGGEE